ncbi:Diadenosine and diphosphoinositol polyphosphate phosphohydrolase [Phaffia rhodozyma]|uniref:Diadenosine and diphosphoinositol polyphosphate phosphohydrolase n=1 Tax=Phaffia rhodozyma TaxID=264483 RepID=A0A0F7SEC1_PHARH|nr:Diadenosine and diphosphoinositol polyphosphate phosphohydrolase [Phaffia rhodozyma]
MSAYSSAYSSASDDGSWTPAAYHGIAKVRGTEENKRMVCCAIPYDLKTKNILLISSRKKAGLWTLPKGGREEGEALPAAALREAWEEGGVRGYIMTEECIREIATARTRIHFFPLQVSGLLESWPEDTREREWVTVEEAISRTYWRPEQAEALTTFLEWRDQLLGENDQAEDDGLDRLRSFVLLFPYFSCS